MGDFNSHHTLWGCMDINDKGRIIEDFITKHDLVLQNDKSSTYLHPVYSAAENSIPRTSTDPKHPNKPWFNNDCKKAIGERKSVLRQFNLRPTQENLSKFKIARAKARRTIKQSKRASWRQ